MSTQGETRIKLIVCDCGEKCVVTTRSTQYLNNRGRREFLTRAESELEIVGFSRNHAWVRVHFKGHAKSTIITMTYSLIHNSAEHQEWEKEQA